MQNSIVVVGAGIVGLDVALVLAEKGLGPYTTVIAEHIPGDTSVNYTSPWAGANFSAISGNDKNALMWDKAGYKRLMALASSQAAESAAVKKTQSLEYWDVMPAKEKIESFAKYLEDFSILPEHQLIPGTKFGVSFTTVTINAPRHIQYLKNKLEKVYGVKFVRQRLEQIDSAFLGRHTKFVFNCVGNAAKTLPGVMDSKCYPTRGQILLVKAPQVTSNVMRHGVDYETYIIPRPCSNGNVVLGGFMQRDNSTGDTFNHESESIWQRTTELHPALKGVETEVLAQFAGLRPSRLGGARVEREDRTGGRILVHNYGAGGTGYQAGLGMAMHAVDLVVEDLNSTGLEKQSRL